MNTITTANSSGIERVEGDILSKISEKNNTNVSDVG